MSEPNDVQELIVRLRDEVRYRKSAPDQYDEGITADIEAAATALEAVVNDRDALLNGVSAVIPQTKYHAQKLYTVAAACLKSFGVDVDAPLAALSARIEGLEKAGDHLRQCANAIVGASTDDPDAAEAFDMFNDARDNWRRAKSNPIPAEPR